MAEVGSTEVIVKQLCIIVQDLYGVVDKCHLISKERYVAVFETLNAMIRDCDEAKKNKQ